MCVYVYICLLTHTPLHNWERWGEGDREKETGITKEPTFFKCLHLTNKCITNHSRINKHFNLITIVSVVS